MPTINIVNERNTIMPLPLVRVQPARFRNVVGSSAPVGRAASIVVRTRRTAKAFSFRLFVFNRRIGSHCRDVPMADGPRPRTQGAVLRLRCRPMRLVVSHPLSHDENAARSRWWKRLAVRPVYGIRALPTEAKDGEQRTRGVLSLGFLSQFIALMARPAPTVNHNRSMSSSAQWR